MDKHAFNVVADFGNLMEELDCMTKFYDINKLPYTKEKITNSLAFAYNTISDPQQKEHIKIALMCLPHFQPGIGDNPIAGLPDLSEVDLGNDDNVKALATQIAGGTEAHSKWQELMQNAEIESAELLRMIEA